MLKIISLCCTTSSFCFWCSGSTWAVACWRVKEVWWRETLSQGRSCKIVSFVSCYTRVDSSISILSTSATAFVSFSMTKSETLPWFCHATSGTKQEGWEWKICMYLLIMASWLLYMHQQPQAFAFIHSVMNEDQYTEPDREEVTRAVLQNFQVYFSNWFLEQYLTFSCISQHRYWLRQMCVLLLAWSCWTSLWTWQKWLTNCRQILQNNLTFFREYLIQSLSPF